MPSGSTNAKLKIFVSYSRADEKFADELVGGLDYDGRFDVSIDRQSIIEGEDWKLRLGSLIADADTVVFVLSPDSAQSSTCSWEVDEAHRLSKRILPVLIRPLGSIPAPARLAALNYVRFDEGRSFIGGLKALSNALNTDLDWIREHTRLLARAMEWEAAKRQPNRMLSGQDIAAAKAWAANRPKDAPEPTDLHRAFIAASEEAETQRLGAERERLLEISAAQTARAAALADREQAVKQLSRRTTLGLAASGTLTALSAGLAYWGVNAESRFRREEEERKRLETAAADERRRRGAARTDIEGQLTAYAASPGQQASDGSGGNSPYTEVLLEALANKNASLSSVLQYDAKKVQAKSSGQRPYFASDMDGDIFLLDQPPSRRKHAFVVGVDKYQSVPALAGATKDGEAWAKFLVRCGFEVTLIRDVILKEFDDKFAEFSTSVKRHAANKNKSPIIPVGFGRLQPLDKSPDNSLALFFFAGQGLSVHGNDRIVMADSKIVDESTATSGTVEVSRIRATMRDIAAASVVILDTNFSDPFKSVR